MTQDTPNSSRRRTVLKTIVASGAITGISTVAAAKEASAETINYESLAPSAQEFFDEARKRGSNAAFAASFPEQLLLHRQVLREDTVYDLRLSTTSQQIEDVLPVIVSDEVTDSVVEVQDLSPQARAIVREAVSADYRAVDTPLPAELHSVEQVRYEDQLYDLNVSKADRTRFKIEPEAE